MSDDNKVQTAATEKYHSTYNEDDNLDLIDVIVQLWHGKKIILTCVCVAIILCLTYLFFAKEAWTSQAVVTEPSSGMVSKYNAAMSVLYMQSPQDKPALSSLQQQLFSRFTLSMNALSSALLNREEPLQLKIEQVNKGINDPISISFSAGTAKEAQQQLIKFIEETNEKIVAGYTADLKRTLSVKTRSLQDALDTRKQVALDKKEQRIEAIKEALKVAEAAGVNKSGLNQAEFLSDDTLYLLGVDALKSMIANESTRPPVYDHVYYETQSALLAVTHLKIDLDRLESFHYIAEPNLPVRRDSPKKTLTMLIAILIGGVAGCAIVIGRNIARNYRERHPD